MADDEPAAAGEIMRLMNEPLPDEADKRPIDVAWQQLVEISKIKEQLGYRPVYPTMQSAVLGHAL